MSDSDLSAIKKEMDKIIKANLPIRREEVTREEARYYISKDTRLSSIPVSDSWIC